MDACLGSTVDSCEVGMHASNGHAELNGVMVSDYPHA